ncbi:uncharacterized protein GLRG_00803 [Colletotrichum graminicola M1.001]|uniref:Uncharacterized protein n=1 Tax=Colletotrichum graminicola (strain M1.001 / M2 / FGSC 10212) TaxID=645133 RepID=E3Q3Q7_COLGM|nr:uncharacterized protein GLRG_00803 [Colletotrichum graminicola M1.001]EFQ25659.1 hypothetical protein GLRG_00803 [Colletotrichum graminicola M1.001]
MTHLLKILSPQLRWISVRTEIAAHLLATLQTYASATVRNAQAVGRGLYAARRVSMATPGHSAQLQNLQGATPKPSAPVAQRLGAAKSALRQIDIALGIGLLPKTGMAERHPEIWRLRQRIAGLLMRYTYEKEFENQIRIALNKQGCRGKAHSKTIFRGIPAAGDRSS